MSIKDLLGRFMSLQVTINDPVWNKTNRENKRRSKLSGAESRLMRDAQSRIRKDIKATEKALKRGENVGAYLNALKSLQSHMRQSNVIDGTRVYNNRTERKEALSRYLMDFAGRNQRETYKTKPVDYVPRDNPLYEHMHGYFDKLEKEKEELKTYYPSIDDLENDLYDSVRKYDYNKAIEILNKMYSLIHDISKQHGTTDYDAY